MGDHVKTTCNTVHFIEQNGVSTLLIAAETQIRQDI